MSGLLAGKTALITGSERGIGKSIALAMARAGARVAAHGLAAPLEADALVRELEQAGSPAAAYFGADLRHVAEIDKLMSDVSAWARPSVLVNNAGIQHTDPIESIAVRSWDDILAVNLSAAFHTMRHVLPQMAREGFGRVINIASVHGLVGSVQKSPYVAAKFGLVGLSKVAALEYAAAGTAESGGVTVNCICPGRVETPFVLARLKEYPDAEKAYRDMASTQLNGRMAKPEEVAAAALYLAADESAMVTGSTLMLDGGWSAGK